MKDQRGRVRGEQAGQRGQGVHARGGGRDTEEDGPVHGVADGPQRQADPGADGGPGAQAVVGHGVLRTRGVQANGGETW